MSAFEVVIVAIVVVVFIAALYCIDGWTGGNGDLW